MNKDILAQKEAAVSALTDRMKDAASIVLVEYRGLTVAEVTELRKLLRAEDFDLQVYKNTIAQRAARSLGYDAFAEVLKGPNALAFGADQVAPARVLAKFAKDHDKLIVKNGVVDGAVVDEETISSPQQGGHAGALCIDPERSGHQVRDDCEGTGRSKGKRRSSPGRRSGCRITGGNQNG